MFEQLLHLQYSKTLFYITMGVIIFTSIINLFLKNYRYVKYIPGLILMCVGLYTVFNTDYGTSKLIGIDNLFMGIALFGSGIVGLCFALILGVYSKEKKDKVKK